MSYLSYKKRDKYRESKRVLNKDISVTGKLVPDVKEHGVTNNRQIKPSHFRIKSLSPEKRNLEEEKDKVEAISVNDKKTKFKFKSSSNMRNVSLNNHKVALVDLNRNAHSYDLRQLTTPDNVSGTLYSQYSTATTFGFRSFSQGKLPNFQLNLKKVTAS